MIVEDRTLMGAPPEGYPREFVPLTITLASGEKMGAFEYQESGELPPGRLGKLQDMFGDLFPGCVVSVPERTVS